MSWSWGWSWGLWGLAILLVMGIFVHWWRRRMRRDLAACGLTTPALSKGFARGRARWRWTCLWLGLSLVVVAFAGPRWGADMTTRVGRGADIMVLLDCSRSMLASDIAPDRMEAARRSVLDLLRVAPDLRLGLIPFARHPVLRCPPTGDRAILGELVADCGPDLFPAAEGRQGTGIGVSVQEALQILARSRAPGQAILVISDGADPDLDSVAKAASAAHAVGVPIFGLFVAEPGGQPELRIDGKMQKMLSDTSTLESLADRTGGLWVGYSLDDRDVELLAQGISRVAKGQDWQERQRVVGAERYRFALIPGIIFLVIGMLIGTRRRTWGE